MSYFVNPDARHRITLTEFDGSDEWVEVREDLSYTQQLAILRAAGGPGVATGTVEANLQASYLELLRQSVTAWSFTDADGSPVPVGDAAFGQLGPVAKWLVDTIDAYYMSRAPKPPVKATATATVGAGTSTTERLPRTRTARNGNGVS